MTKKQVIDFVNTYYGYHIGKTKVSKKFKLISSIQTPAGWVTGYGVYFNFDKTTYKHKGGYLHAAALHIKNPFITSDQLYSALISYQAKRDLYKKGYDSVVLVKKDKIVEIVVFTNAQISVEQIDKLD